MCGVIPHPVRYIDAYRVPRWHEIDHSRCEASKSAVRVRNANEIVYVFFFVQQAVAAVFEAADRGIAGRTIDSMAMRRKRVIWGVCT